MTGLGQELFPVNICAVSDAEFLRFTKAAGIDGERYLDFLCRDNLRRDRILDWLGEPQMIYRHQELYADTAAEIALRENIPLIPVRQTFLRNHRLSQLIAADGIHLTMPGYEQLFDTLADWVKHNI